MRPSIITRDFLAQRVGSKSVFVEDVTKKVEELEKLVFPVTNGYQQLYDNFDFIVDAMDVFQSLIDEFVTVTEEVYSEYDDDVYFYDLIELNRLYQRLDAVLSHIEVLSFHLSSDMKIFAAVQREDDELLMNGNWLMETVNPRSKKAVKDICKMAKANFFSSSYFELEFTMIDHIFNLCEQILSEVEKLTPSVKELECAFHNQFQLYWNDIRDEVASVLGRQHKALMHVCENLQKDKSWEKFAMVEEDALGLAVCSKLTASDDKRHRIYDKETREKYEKYKEVVDRFLEVCMGHNDELFDIKWRTVNEKGLIEVLDTYSYEFADELIARRNYVVKKIYGTGKMSPNDCNIDENKKAPVKPAKEVEFESSQAQKYWRKLREAGYVDNKNQLMFKIEDNNLNKAAYIALRFNEVLRPNLRRNWDYFKKLWGVEGADFRNADCVKPDGNLPREALEIDKCFS